MDGWDEMGWMGCDGMGLMDGMGWMYGMDGCMGWMG